MTAPELDLRTGDYVVGERRLPRVSAILAAAGLSGFDRVAEHRLEPARQRGTSVHQLCAEYDLAGGVFDAGEHGGYVESWRLFREKWGWWPVLVEQPVADLERGYAGTLDVAMVSGWPSGNEFAVVDRKSGDIPASTGIQLAAYAAALRAQYGLKRWPKRIAVRLYEDGSLPRVREYPMVEMARDLGRFYAALDEYKAAA